MSLIPIRKSDWFPLWRLYRKAFPVAERKPLSLLIRQRKLGQSEILSIQKNGRFVGFIIVLFYRDTVLLDFFAICEQARSGGIGAEVLKALVDRYRERRLFLEIERITPDADNREQRIRRKRFYLRNGMQESGVSVYAYNSDMELLHATQPVSFEEYCALLKATLPPSYYAAIAPQKAQ